MFFYFIFSVSVSILIFLWFFFDFDFFFFFFFFSSRRRHTRYWRDWSSDVCSSDLFVEVLTDLATAGVVELAVQVAVDQGENLATRHVMRTAATHLASFPGGFPEDEDRKSTRLNSSHANISYAVFCLKKKTRKRYKD